MEKNEILRTQVSEVVDNQISANDPPETSGALTRLQELGYDENDAKTLIGKCVEVEIVDILKSGDSFDKNRYLDNLSTLPKEPNKDQPSAGTPD